MNIYNIIDKKRHNEALTKEEIEYFVTNYTNNEIPDYQASALLMAIAINGMNDEEITNLTMAMAKSGDFIDLSNINGVTIDKHSSGGVGDKTTLIIAPIIACLGGKVAKMSGRALGYTGGTIDKLESVGVKVELTNEQFIKQVNEIGVAIISQTVNIAPADKKLYALRDVTATVDSIPLITSSIMSKKIAGSAKNLVLDIKVGNGAFIKNIADATNLGNKMCSIGKSCGLNVKAVITNMNYPLGNKIGNTLEVEEAMEVLQNKGPKDLRDVSITLASMMNVLINKVPYEEAKKQVLDVISDGSAYRKFVEWITYQGGNLELPKSKYTYEIKSNKSGYIISMDTENIGKVSCRLGSGRLQKNDTIDYTAGITITKKTNEYINVGDTIALFHTNKDDIKDLEQLYLDSLIFSESKLDDYELVLKVIE